MNIVIVSASMRASSQSKKVSLAMVPMLEKFGANIEVIDLYELKLPFYDDGETTVPQIGAVKESLQQADGFVFVTPEWNGMISHGLLNLFHYLQDELAHKPVLPVAVSASKGGAYPIEQLKMMGSKNRHFVVIPEHVIVRNVETVLNGDVAEHQDDTYIRERLGYACGVLCAYSDALQHVRQNSLVDQNRYPNGM